MGTCGVLSWQAGILLRWRTQFWWLGMVMGTGLAGCAVVSPPENNTVHVFFALVFFAGACVFQTAMTIEACRACHSRTLQPLFKTDLRLRRASLLMGGGSAFAWCCLLGAGLEAAGVFGKQSQTKLASFEIAGTFEI